MGIIYIIAALAAVVLEHWWPLVAGFGVLWVLRGMGMEPEAPNAVDTPAADADKKT